MTSLSTFDVRSIDYIQNAVGELLTTCGRKETLMEQKLAILPKLEESQAYVSSKDRLNAAFDSLSEQVQQKECGRLEMLLTYLIESVMPDNGLKIKLQQEMLYNKPALSILGIRDGQPEDVWEDHGGSIDNLVSTGLRLITLLRSGHRQFCILDEPDCWMSEQYIEPFFKAMTTLSREQDVQLLIITHHLPALPDDARHIHLEKQEGDIVAQVKQEGAVLSEAGEEGKLLRLRLKNIKSHRNTEISFGRYTTFVTGANDLGKTHIVNALRFLRDGTANDRIFTHGEKSASVELDYDIARTIKYDYSANRSRRTIYSLVTPEGVKEWNEGGRLPDWLDGELGLGKLDKDVELHMPSQKQPSFLLDLSPARRAAIMPLGKNSEIVKKAAVLHAKSLKEHRANLRHYRNQLQDIEQQIERLAHINIDEVKELTKLPSELQVADALLVHLGDSCSQLAALNHTVSQCQALRDDQQPESIDNASVMNIDRVALNLQSLARTERTLNNLQSDELVEPAGIEGEVQVWQSLVKQGRSLFRLEKMLRNVASLPSTDLLSAQSENELLALKSAIDMLTRMSALPKVIEAGGEPVVTDAYISRLFSRIKVLERVSGVSDLPAAPVEACSTDEGASSLMAAIEKLAAIKVNISHRESQLHLDSEILTGVRSRKSSLLLTINNCPTCGQQIELDGACHEQ